MDCFSLNFTVILFLSVLCPSRIFYFITFIVKISKVALRPLSSDEPLFYHTSFDIGRRTAFWQKQVAFRTYSSPFPNETKGLILIIFVLGITTTFTLTLCKKNYFHRSMSYPLSFIWRKSVKSVTYQIFKSNLSLLPNLYLLIKPCCHRT